MPGFGTTVPPFSVVKYSLLCPVLTPQPHLRLDILSPLAPQWRSNLSTWVTTAESLPTWHILRILFCVQLTSELQLCAAPEFISCISVTHTNTHNSLTFADYSSVASIFHRNATAEGSTCLAVLTYCASHHFMHSHTKNGLICIWDQQQEQKQDQPQSQDINT